MGIALVAVVLALGFGAFRARTDGRFRGTRRIAGASDVLAPDTPTAGTPTSEAAGSPQSPAVAVLGTDLGERATLVQLSSAFCAPCRTTRRVLADVAEKNPGIVHVEIDAEHHLDLVRALDVTRTPTTLILDATGREISRAAGAPRREQVLQALPPA